jgi:hypothetical protein
MVSTFHWKNLQLSASHRKFLYTNANPRTKSGNLFEKSFHPTLHPPGGPGSDTRARVVRDHAISEITDKVKQGNNHVHKQTRAHKCAQPTTNRLSTISKVCA